MYVVSANLKKKDYKLHLSDVTSKFKSVTL